MPGSGITITNTFATQSGNVPASQLDTNFSQLAMGFNSLASYANYFVDSGSVNTLVISVPSPLVASYTAGTPFQVKVANTNTGAATLNVNSLGAVNIVYPNGSALSAGQLQAGAIVPLQYDGSHFQYLGGAASINGTASLAAGGFSSSFNFTLNYSISGSIVVATILASTNTSNSVSFTLGGVPSVLQPPATTQEVPLSGVSNGSASVYSGASIQVASASSTWLVLLNGGPNWIASGLKGFTFPAQSFCYLLV